MKVLVIPEDFRNDQFVLEPIIRAMFGHLQRPSARIAVCRDPLLGGIGQALRWEKLAEVVERYPMVDLFLLLVDRDGKSGRKSQLTQLERRAAKEFGTVKLLAENAWQEVEVWALAGHPLPAKWKWTEIRGEPNPKEVFFLPFARMQNLVDEPGEGRGSIARAAAKKYSRVRSRCPELVDLETRIEALL